MDRRIRRVAAFSLSGVVWIATDCDNDPARGPNDVTTTSASVLHPAAAPAAVRMVDNTGFVDNGGRTDDEVARTEMSGMRPTEMGSERVTGTPGVGVPLPFVDPTTPPRFHGLERERPVAAERVAAAGIPRTVVSGTMTQALCRRDAACARQSQDHDYPTLPKCTAGSRGRAREEIEGSGCTVGFDADRVAACLNAIRQTDCSVHLSSAGDIPACDGRLMCRP
jgi:hypothetical protein